MYEIINIPISRYKKSDIKIIDSHFHIGKWGKQTIFNKDIEPFENREYDSYKKIIHYLKEKRIDKIVGVPVYSSNTFSTFSINYSIYEYAKKNKEIIIPGFWIDPSPKCYSTLINTLNFADEKNIKVFKIAPNIWEKNYSLDPITWDKDFKKSINLIIDFLREKKAILQIHTGSKKSSIQTIEKFFKFAKDGFTIHLVHLGNTISGHFYLVPRIEKWISDGIDVIFDTSLSRAFALKWLISKYSKNLTILNRILFASDEPWSFFEVEFIKVLYASDEKPEIYNRIFWFNPNHYYFRGELK